MPCRTVLFRIFVRGNPVTGDLPPNDQRILIAKMLEAAIPETLSAVASQAFQLCGQIVQQQQQAAAKIQPADEVAEAVVVEAAAKCPTYIFADADPEKERSAKGCRLLAPNGFSGSDG